MNILFLSLLDFTTFDEKNIYSDLLREFIKHGHNVFCISPVERRKKEKTHLLNIENSCILKLKIGNVQKTNVIEKGISTLLIEHLFIKGIKKYFSKNKFDLVLYATPPVTFEKVIRFVKKRDKAKSYLMLKDIFPQNAVDIGMMSTSGIKGVLYKFFRNKEKNLYKQSDTIGCMSRANVEYLLKHNAEIDKAKVEICYNSIEIQDNEITNERKADLRNKYGVPLEKKVFVYGGNLGKPQGIPFIIDCLRAESNNDKAFFLIVGDGTEFSVIEDFINRKKPQNVKLLRRLPKEDYEQMICACDVGLIFLDYRFTIPNFPSRLLSYMQAGLPVIASTDTNSDIGEVIVKGGFGWWCESNDVNQFSTCIKEALNFRGDSKKEKDYLREHFSVEKCYETIVKSVGGI